MAVNGKALATLGVGILFTWSGIKGWSVLGTLQDLIAGRPPTERSIGPLVNEDGETSSNGSGKAVGRLKVTGNLIADTALQYQGHRYVFGGAPKADASGPWDCSSFVNYVIGVKLGGPIPGYSAGKYDGSTHGPTTLQWGAWTLPKVSRADVRAGDIIVWTGHMGIAVSNTELVNALNPSRGTVVTSIDSSANGPVMGYFRYAK